MRRHKMSKSSSKSSFRRSGSHTHVKNIRAAPMRGGIRL
ncbi:hypothetical protein [robinz microvirus RP_78]|nr:hypothetical protein [robinz microvirus RP_78]